MTQHHKKLAQKRINARQGKLHMWKLALLIVVPTLVLSIAGAMDWSDEAPTVSAVHATK